MLLRKVVVSFTNAQKTPQIFSTFRPKSGSADRNRGWNASDGTWRCGPAAERRCDWQRAVCRWVGPETESQDECRGYEQEELVRQFQIGKPHLFHNSSNTSSIWKKGLDCFKDSRIENVSPLSPNIVIDPDCVYVCVCVRILNRGSCYFHRLHLNARIIYEFLTFSFYDVAGVQARAKFSVKWFKIHETRN